MLQFTAVFVDASDHRAQGEAPLTLWCAGLAGGACAGTCTDLDSDPAHCGGCDQPCATRCKTGGCGPPA